MSDQAATRKRRDWTVQLMRIIACMIVIGVHSLPNVKISSGVYSTSRVFLSCVFADGVAIFWMISGFYLFRNFSYRKLLKRSAAKILVPYLLCEAFIFYFYDFIAGRKGLLESISHGWSDYAEVIKKALSLQVLAEHSNHYWYIIAYLMVIAASPLLYAFAEKYLTKPASSKIFAAAALGLLVLNDVSLNNAMHFSHYGARALVCGSLFVLLGFIVYENRGLFKNRIWRVLAPALFFGLNLLRMFIQLWLYTLESSPKTIIYWYTSFGAVNALLVAAFCFSFSDENENESRFHAAIDYVGSLTFWIYLIHKLVQKALRSLGVLAFIKRHATGSGQDNIFTNSAYSLLTVLAIFTVSALICAALKEALKILSRLWPKSAASSL